MWYVACVSKNIAILKKPLRKRVLTFKTAFKGLYATATESDLLPNQFTILAETDELLPTLLHADVIATLTKYQKYFVSLHVTDQANLPRW
jgi:hypothetical protein